ncbi:hypothetical protein [Enterococcus sp. AZ109]|uniref:hypothetical protein n=1 Tax=Enterococcus sp. AZ109 TaxID=2774634 RepID=UPI003F284CAE
MKKLAILLLLCSALLFAACSNNDTDNTVDSSAKVETKASEEKDEKEKKLAEEKKKAEQAEKEKQELISQKVKVADEAMKAAEANPTDETYNTAKTAVEAIPDGNEELQKRLEAVAANLEVIKQQAAVQEQQTQQQQTANPDPDFIDADGNGFDDRSVFNDPAARAEYARGEAEAQRQWEQGQQNIQNGYDPNGQPLLPGQDHAAGSNPDGTPDSWVQGQLDRLTPDGGYMTDYGVIYPE